MAVIDLLKLTLSGVTRVARSASHQVQGTAAPVIRQAARQVRSQLEQRRGATSPPEPPASPTRADAPEADAPATAEPAAPTPAEVARNIAPQPAAARSAAKRKPAKKSAPGAKLPVKRAATRPDSA